MGLEDCMWLVGRGLAFLPYNDVYILIFLSKKTFDVILIILFFAHFSEVRIIGNFTKSPGLFSILTARQPVQGYFMIRC